MSVLEETVCEKDLGVFIDPNLNFEEHVNYVLKKTRSLSGLIMRTIHYKTKDIMVPLFKSIIRPILEYGNVVWNPILRKHIDSIEAIQRHFTRCIIGMKDLDYNQRLRALGLPSLEYRRVRGDLIEMYKMTHDLYDTVTTKALLTLDKDSITRTNNYKLTKPRVKSKQFQHFFTNRVINTWNKLSDRVVGAGSLNTFKNAVDDHFRNFMYSTNLNFY